MKRDWVGGPYLRHGILHNEDVFDNTVGPEVFTEFLRGRLPRKAPYEHLVWGWI